MSKKAIFLAAGLLAAVPLAQADEAGLQQQLEALQQRVTELERRLNTLETPQIREAIRAATGPEAPGQSEVASNWEFLKVGYSYEKVRELLGEPLQIKSGAMEFWFYSDRGLEGPFVKFLFNKVNSWKAPAAR